MPRLRRHPSLGGGPLPEVREFIKDTRPKTRLALTPRTRRVLCAADKAIARRRRRTERGAREGALTDHRAWVARRTLVPVRVAIVWLDTRPLSVAQGRAVCGIPQRVRAAFSQRANVDFSSRSSTTSRRWRGVRDQVLRNEAGEPARVHDPYGGRRHRRLREDGALRLPSRLPAQTRG